MEIIVEYYQHMQTIQVVLDEELLHAADRTARRIKVNRSALIREALRAHIERLQIREMERLDREGYERHPDTESDLAGWERVAVWPEG